MLNSTAVLEQYVERDVRHDWLQSLEGWRDDVTAAHDRALRVVSTITINGVIRYVA